MNELFNETLELLTQDPTFRQSDLETQQAMLSETRELFIRDEALLDQAEVDELSKQLADKNQEVRQAARAGRASLNQDDAYAKIFSELNNKFEFDITEEGQISDDDQNRDKIEKARGEIRSVINQYPELIPNANDFEFMANRVFDQTVRKIDGKDTGAPMSAAANFAQGATTRIAATIPGVEAEGFNEFFKENPKYDDSFWVGKLPTGVGDVGATMAMVMGASAATGGGATGAAVGAAVSGYSNAATRYQEAYDNEFLFSGDVSRAKDAGAANLPAAAVDSIGDFLLVKGLVPKGFTNLSKTDKLKYIQTNVPTKDVFKAVAGNFAAQGGSEVIGDSVSGALQYNETGNPEVVPTFEELRDSFLIGGIIGGAGGSFGQLKQASEISQFKIDQGEATDTKVDGQSALEGVASLEARLKSKVGTELDAETELKANEEKATEPEVEADETTAIETPTPNDSFSEQIKKERAALATLEVTGQVDPAKLNKFKAELDRREAAQTPPTVEPTEAVDDAPIDRENLLAEYIEVTSQELAQAQDTAEQVALQDQLDTLQGELDRVQGNLTKDGSFLTEREKLAQQVTQNSRDAAKKVRDQLIQDRANELNIKFKEKLAAEEGILVNDQGEVTGFNPDNSTTRRAALEQAAKDQALELDVDAIAETIKELATNQLSREKQELAEELGFRPSTLTGAEAELKRRTEEGTAQLSDREVAVLIATENSRRQARKVLDNIEKDNQDAVIRAKEKEFKEKLLAEEGIDADEAIKSFSTNLSNNLGEAGFVNLEVVANSAASIMNGAISVTEFTKQMVAKLGQGIAKYAPIIFADLKAQLGRKIEAAMAKIGGIKYIVDPNQEGKAVETDPDLAEVQSLIDQLLNEQSGTNTNPESGTEAPLAKVDANAEKTLTASRNQIKKRFSKVAKDRIKSSKDRHTSEWITRKVIPSLNALAEVNDEVAVLAYEVVQNYNESRAALERRFGDIHTKLNELSDPLMQEGLAAFGVENNESLADFITKAGDQALIQRKVEAYADWIPGLAEAYTDGQFETYDGLDKLTAFLQGTSEFQEAAADKKEASEKRQAELDELEIKFLETTIEELQKKELSDTYVGEGLAEKNNTEAAQGILSWLQKVDARSIEDRKTRRLIALTADSLLVDGTFVHSTEALKAHLEMTKAELAAFGKLKFWNSSPFGNGKGLTERISSTPQRLAMLSHDKASVAFLENLYQDLSNAGVRNEVLTDQLKDRFQDILTDSFSTQVTDDQSIRMGLATQLTQYDASRDRNEYLQETLGNLTESAKRALESGDKKTQRHYTKVLQHLNDLAAKADLSSETNFSQMEAAVDQWLTAEEKKAINDTRAMFGEYTNDMRFISEAIRNRPFQEIVNYFVTSQISVDGSIEGPDSKALDSLKDGRDLLSDDAKKVGLAAAMGNTKQRVNHLLDDNMYLVDFVGLTMQGLQMTAFEVTTAVARRKTSLKLNNKFVQNIVAQSTDGKAANPQRIKVLRKWFEDESIAMFKKSAYVGDYHRMLKGLVSRVASVKLSGGHRYISESLSNMLDFAIKNPFNLAKQGMFAKANAVFANERYDQLYLESGMAQRAALGEEGFQGSVDAKSIRNNGKVKAATDLANGVQKVLRHPLDFGDRMSARSRFLTEYAWLEVQDERATGLSDIDLKNLNEENMFKARLIADQTVGTTIPSSKGIFYQSHRKDLSLFRDMTMAFTAHGATMGAQATTAARNAIYFGKHLDAKGMAKEAQKVAAITAQSAGFVFGKYATNLLMFTVVAASFRAALDDEEMEALRGEAEALSNKRGKTDAEQAQLKDLKKDLLYLQSTRDQLKQYQRSNFSAEGVFKKFGADAASNLIYPLGMLPPLRDKAAILVEKNQEKAYQTTKKFLKAELIKSAKEAQAEGDFKLEGKIRQQIEDLEGLRFLKIHRTEFGTAPVAQGVMGIGFEDLSRFGEEATSAMAGHKEFSLGDLNLLANGLGFGQTDVTRWAQFNDKIQNRAFAKAKADKEREELNEISALDETEKPKKESRSLLEAKARLLLKEP